MKGALLIDIGSTYTKVTGVDMEGEAVIGTAKAFTTVQSDVNEGLETAIRELEIQTGKVEYERKLACSSAAGGLKMIAVGLVPDLTAEAAKMAALSAGAKVLKTYSYELNPLETEEIYSLKPDIILLSGGTDGGNSKVIIHNAWKLAGIGLPFPVVVAGNKSVSGEVASILAAFGKEARICGNVMPEFNRLEIEPARQVIREIFLERIILAKGLSRVTEFVEGILMPTPSAVLNAARTLSRGADGEEGWGDLMVADVGGATTDIYSIADGLPTGSNIILKGLPEPFEKRTVEGDLGVRYNAGTLAETAGMEALRESAGLSAEEVARGLALIGENPSLLPMGDDILERLDQGLAAMAVRLASDRHAGRIETAYTPYGVAYVQTGKDLGPVEKVIGTGGPLVNSLRPAAILRHILFDGRSPQMLKPKNAQFLIDRQYILAAMGLLCTQHPSAALRMMKKELKTISWS